MRFGVQGPCQDGVSGLGSGVAGRKFENCIRFVASLSLNQGLFLGPQYRLVRHPYKKDPPKRNPSFEDHPYVDLLRARSKKPSILKKLTTKIRV